MKRIIYPILLLLIIVTGFEAKAQRGRKRPFQPKNPMAIVNAKWMMGIKGSVNFSQLETIKSYEVLDAPYIEGLSDSAKVYAPYSENRGYAVALTIGYFPVRMLGLVFEPAFSSYQFSYDYNLGWMLNEAGSSLQRSYTHAQQVSYIDLPLMLRINPLKTRFKVHVQAGGYYGFRLNALKKMNWSETLVYAESLREQIVQQKEVYTAITNQFNPSHFGVILGGGISYDIQNWRIGLETNYKMGFSELINPAERYSRQELASAHYDVPDNLQWKQLEVSASLSIPLDNLVQEDGAFPGKRK